MPLSWAVGGPAVGTSSGRVVTERAFFFKVQRYTKDQEKKVASAPVFRRRGVINVPRLPPSVLSKAPDHGGQVAIYSFILSLQFGGYLGGRIGC